MSAFNSTIASLIAVEDNRLLVGVVSTAVILAITAAYYNLSSKDRGREFPRLRGIQLYHAWNFFRRRHDFLHSNFGRNPGKSFSFSVLRHNVIALAGDDARRVFYSNPHLSISEGYKNLKGAIPRLSDVEIMTEEIEERNRAMSFKRLNTLLNKTRIQHILPTLLQDITDEVYRWGDDGKVGIIDPFTNIFDLVFATAARMISCRDLATNRADLKKMGELFMTLQTSATPTSVLLPWYPSPTRKAGKQATTELYAMIYTYVETRRRAEPTTDAIDILIADGETTQKIVEFVMSMVFVAIINTGNISCWMLVDLAVHPEWREKCKKEIRDLLSRHLGDTLSSATLSEKLGVLPISAWEDELPIFEACIRESQRILFAHVALRRNVREDIKISEKVVKRGDFLAYSPADVHLNPKYYPEPHKYDPGRWLRPDPVVNTTYPFLGWGAGRHPCTGIKVAKVEMKLILAMFLTKYEFDLVDKNRNFPSHLPVPNRNDMHRVRPLGATCYLNFKKVAQ